MPCPRESVPATALTHILEGGDLRGCPGPMPRFTSKASMCLDEGTAGGQPAPPVPQLTLLRGEMEGDTGTVRPCPRADGSGWGAAQLPPGAHSACREARPKAAAANQPFP